MFNAHPKPLRVLMISGTWPPMTCGVGDYTACLCSALGLQQVQVEVITSTAAAGSGSHPGVTVHPVVAQWGRGLASVIIEHAARLRPDLVHLQWPTAVYGRSWAVNRLAGLIRQAYPQIPVVLTLHEYRYFKPWTRWRLHPAVRAARQIIVVDPQDQQAIRRRGVVPETALTHIPIGSNLPLKSPGFQPQSLRQDLGFTPSEFVVAFFGFPNRPKGLEVVLEALRQLLGHYPQIRFLWLSQEARPGPYLRRLQQRLAKLNLQAITRTPAYVSPQRAADLLAAADCAALPFRDGASLKRGSLLACLAQGLPVVTTQPARDEAGVFRDGENMLLIQPGSPLQLTRALEQVLTQPALRQRLSQGALEMAAGFTWDRIAIQHVALYRCLLEVRE